MVRRGDIRLFVTYRQGKPGEVSFVGLPFASGSTVDLECGRQYFQTVHRWRRRSRARPKKTPRSSARLAGSDVKLQRGLGAGHEDRRYSSSLLGFTAASEEAAKRCK
ncbi:MAG: hypothetical protein R3D78_06845 [Paracoccaceae bacterium]